MSCISLLVALSKVLDALSTTHQFDFANPVSRGVVIGKGRIPEAHGVQKPGFQKSWIPENRFPYSGFHKSRIPEDPNSKCPGLQKSGFQIPGFQNSTIPEEREFPVLDQLGEEMGDGGDSSQPASTEPYWSGYMGQCFRTHIP